MKQSTVFLAFLLFFAPYTYSQFEYVILDSIGVHETMEEPLSKVSTIDLTGNFNELVVAIGFPDVSNSIPFPTYSIATYFPHQGVFPDGTLLEDYIIANGGTIPIDEWLEPGMDYYFDLHSGGQYTVDFEFIKQSNGNRYLTTNNFSYFVNLNGGSTDNVIWNYRYDICSEVVTNIWLDDPQLLDNIDVLHFTFEGFGNEFHTIYGGTVGFNVTFTAPNGEIIYDSKPVSYQRRGGAILHERLHFIGALAGYPENFGGLPDRGWDRTFSGGHGNLTKSYDIMYHNGEAISQRSLWAKGTLLSHDLIFFGWIKPEEILDVNENNFNLVTIKLRDINYPLTPSQIGGDFHRIAKIMIHENYNGELDEYLLVEYHKGTEFDKASNNYDEFPIYGYNEGILIWHIKERYNALDIFRDNEIDLEVAVPYNGWYGNPVPPTPFPRDYNRPSNWNGNKAGDYDYLDDLKRFYNSSIKYYQYYYMPDGGTHIWNYTLSPEYFVEYGGHYPWDPSGEDWPVRSNSLRSSFFTDESINGTVTNSITDITRPSSKDWGGSKTHLAIKNIRHVDDYMMIDVYYNYWVGEITENSTMSGDVIIGGDIIIPEGITLTIAAGSELYFDDGASLIVDGILNANGTSSDGITFDFITKQSNNGIKINSGATANIYYSDILNAINGIYFNSATGIADHCTITNCYYGVYVTSATPTIQYCSINNNYYGLRIFNSYSQSWTARNIANNSITGNTAYGVYLYNSSPTLTYNTITGNHIGSSFWLSSNPILNNNNFNNNSNYGVACYGNASPNAYFNTSYSFGGYNNVISNGNRGIVVTSTSHPNFGNPGLSTGGYNSIYDNTGYEIDNSAPNFFACNNWWNNPSGPQPGDINGSVRTVPYLYQDPNPSKSTSGGPTLISAAYSDVPEELQEAEYEMTNNNYRQATYLLRNYLIEHTDDNSFGNMAAVLFLKNLDFYLDQKGIAKEVESFLENKLSRNGQFELLLGLSSVLSKDGNYNAALNCLEKLEDLKPTIEENNKVLFQKAFINLFGMQDLDNVLFYLNEILERNEHNSLDYQLAMEEINSLSNSLDLMPKSYNKETSAKLPETFNLLGNYPNPFNPTTTIEYSIPEASFVELKIYDILGGEAASLVNENKPSGKYSVKFNAENLPSGVYFYRIVSGNFTATKKLIILK